MQPMATRSPATLTYRDVVTIRVVVVASVVAISGRVTYSPSAPQHSWWGIGSPVHAGTPTADSARTPCKGCVLCRSRIGVSRLSFRLVGVLSAPVGGALGAGTAAVVVAGCSALVVPGPPSQQMSCQHSRVGRCACVPPVWSHLNRSRRQRGDQRKQQSGGSSRAVVGSARGGRDTTTEYCRSPAAAAATTGAAGEREAGCGRAATVAGGGGRCALAAAFGGRTAGRGAGGWREDWCQRTAPAPAAAACTAGC